MTHRRWLDSGWEIGPVAPGAAAPAQWLPIGAPQPLAAALAAAGQWSLDGPARDFDAEDWCYRVAFDADPGTAWTLGLDGLATLAEVRVNGELVLESRNMFRAHRVALPALQAAGNLLQIRFRPLAAELARRRPRPRWRVPMLQQQQLRWLRTTLLGRTPGWSPPAAVVGPWRGVWLAPAGSAAALDAPRVVATLEPEGGVGGRPLGRVRVSWPEAPAGDVPPRLRLSHAGAAVAEARARPHGAGWEAELQVDDPPRWWPHTHGEPVLLGLSVQAPEGWRPLAHIGFRTLELDTTGGGFALRVNGEPVFCRGACWTPPDPLRLHAAPADYAALLVRVRDAGMNMLRVAGPMVYEHPAFFEACDAAGVLVWQDLMFASMDYPDDPAFLAEVDAEVAQQLDGWGGHASLALLCGNSEVSQQAAMWGAPREAWSSPLFTERLPALVAARLPGVPWWPSSAWGGAFPFQPSAGTCSYYGVGAYRRAPGDARESGLRFAAECLAFANVPGDDTLARVPGLSLRAPVHAPAWKARVPRDLGAGWDFDDVRDHYAEWLLGAPVGPLRASDPAHYLALSRAASGVAMAEAMAHWRRADSGCGGALVWTLRDFLAGAGWGLLDERGRPKPAFHLLARACRPQHLALVDEGLDGLCAHLQHEGADPIDGELRVTLYQHDEVPVAEGTHPLRLAGRGRARVPLVAALPHFVDVTWAYRFGPPAVSLAVAQWWRAGDAQPLAEACWFAPGVLARRHPDIGLQATVAPPDPTIPGRRRVRVRTRAAAWGLHAESDGWRPLDEFMHLAPGAAIWIDFEPCEPVAAGGRPPPWRVMLRALNTHQCVVVPEAADAAEAPGAQAGG